jgi:alkylated DNA repair protein (DNA oxidative demethylase)
MGHEARNLRDCSVWDCAFPYHASMSAQSALFEVAADPRIEGLTYVANAVGPDVERDLVRYIETLEFKPFEWRGFTGNRRTVSFGYRYDFNGGGFQTAEAIPETLQRARSLVCARLGEVAKTYEQCSVIEYATGAGIGWHKDRPQFAKVAGLSLLAPCRLRFRRDRDGGGWAREALSLEPRSAYLLDGEARRVWQHSIAPMDRLRYSITFRTLAQ